MCRHCLHGLRESSGWPTRWVLPSFPLHRRQSCLSGRLDLPGALRPIGGGWGDQKPGWGAALPSALPQSLKRRPTRVGRIPLMTPATLWPKPRAQLKQHKNSQLCGFSHSLGPANPDPAHKRTLPRPAGREPGIKRQEPRPWLTGTPGSAQPLTPHDTSAHGAVHQPVSTWHLLGARGHAGAGDSAQNEPVALVCIRLPEFKPQLRPSPAV